MGTHVQFVAPDDVLWRETLAEIPHDVYHTPEYALLSERTEGGKAGAFIYRRGRATLLWPMVVRALPPALCAGNGLRDATGVYGYGAPVYAPATTSAEVFEALAAIGASAEAMGIVSVFSRLHPLLPFAPSRVPDTCVVADEGMTAGIDLFRDEADLWAGLRDGHREDIRKLVAKGFRVDWAAWHRLPEFVGMYHQTMERVGARAYYRFADGYFRQLAADLEPYARLGLVTDPEGNAAAGSLFFEHQGIVQYHLSATSGAHLKHAPAKLLVWEAARRSAAAGNRVLHLGGGTGGKEDSLLRFKLGFATDRYTFRTLRFVTAPDAYRALCARSRAADDVQPCPLGEGFFPAYRAAPPSPASP